MLLSEIVSYLEHEVPLLYQESYDNSGLQIGDLNMKIDSAVIALDVTEDIVQEAIDKKYNLIVSHHPLIFSGVKKIIGRNYVERIIKQLIKNDIALYSCHTNLDSIDSGVNQKIAEYIGLEDCKVLSPVKNKLRKIVTFAPTEHAGLVRSAIFDAGAGVIGDYDNCSYNINGEGSFRGTEHTNQFVGKKNETHFEKETRIETIVPVHKLNSVISSMIKAHPYEEVAYDIYPLENEYKKFGMGMIGQLKRPMTEEKFLEKLKRVFRTGTIRHTDFLGRQVKRVAICGGSGSSLIGNAIREKADVFITGDIKYHQFFDADKKIILADIGHYESEQFTKEVIYELLIKKFPNFAAHLTETDTNPINYI